MFFIKGLCLIFNLKWGFLLSCLFIKRFTSVCISSPLLCNTQLQRQQHKITILHYCSPFVLLFLVGFTPVCWEPWLGRQCWIWTFSCVSGGWGWELVADDLSWNNWATEWCLVLQKVGLFSWQKRQDFERMKTDRLRLITDTCSLQLHSLAS